VGRGPSAEVGDPPLPWPNKPTWPKGSLSTRSGPTTGLGRGNPRSPSPDCAAAGAVPHTGKGTDSAPMRMSWRRNWQAGGLPPSPRRGRGGNSSLPRAKDGGGGHPPDGFVSNSGRQRRAVGLRAGDEDSRSPGPRKKQPSEIGEGRRGGVVESPSSKSSSSEAERRRTNLLPASSERVGGDRTSERRPRRRPSARRRSGDEGDPVSPPKSPERRPRRCLRHILSTVTVSWNSS
jgi:hypothetical protein